jgi:hypothetical protein
MRYLLLMFAVCLVGCGPISYPGQHSIWDTGWDRIGWGKDHRPDHRPDHHPDHGPHRLGPPWQAEVVHTTYSKPQPTPDPISGNRTDACTCEVCNCNPCECGNAAKPRGIIQFGPQTNPFPTRRTNEAEQQDTIPDVATMPGVTQEQFEEFKADIQVQLSTFKGEVKDMIDSIPKPVPEAKSPMPTIPNSVRPPVSSPPKQPPKQASTPVGSACGAGGCSTGNGYGGKGRGLLGLGIF